MSRNGQVYVAAHISPQLHNRLVEAQAKLQLSLKTRLTQSEIIRRAIERLCDDVIEHQAN